MKTARDILEDLARKSYQAKPTGSYYSIVDKALKDLDALVPKKKDGTIMIQSVTLQNEARLKAEARNQAIDEIHKIFKGDK